MSPQTFRGAVPAQAASAAFFAREEGLRQEVSRLEDRTRALEEETAELAAASSDHTRPLMRWAPSRHASRGSLCIACLAVSESSEGVEMHSVGGSRQAEVVAALCVDSEPLMIYTHTDAEYEAQLMA